MTNEFAFYHGVVFTSLIHFGSTGLSLSQYPSPDNSSYVINGSIGVYLKYSTKRLSPWHFSFEKRHNATIAEMTEKLGRVIVILVCRDDGVAGLTADEFRRVVDTKDESTVWLSVTRRPREKYAIKGPLGKLAYKIGMTDYCAKVLS